MLTLNQLYCPENDIIFNGKPIFTPSIHPPAQLDPPSHPLSSPSYYPMSKDLPKRTLDKDYNFIKLSILIVDHYKVYIKSQVPIPS